MRTYEQPETPHHVSRFWLTAINKLKDTEFFARYPFYYYYVFSFSRAAFPILPRYYPHNLRGGQKMLYDLTAELAYLYYFS